MQYIEIDGKGESSIDKRLIFTKLSIMVCPGLGWKEYICFVALDDAGFP